MDLRIGCCGFPIARDAYYNRFHIVEIEQSFYQPPKAETAKRWRESAPNNFEFILKAWQLITHEPTSPTYRRLKTEIKKKEVSNYGFFKPTDEVFKAWNQVDEIATLLGANLILFQCPASFKPEKKNIKNLRTFFKKVKRKNYRFIWEPRGDWDAPGIIKLCVDLNLVHCVDPFKKESLYGDFRYFRLHGITGYRYKYTDLDLERLKEICTKDALSLKKDRAIYVVFNNATMVQDADRFCKIRLKDASL
jgi:uncharacterized protein YecE (DUF72 family)